MSILQHHSTKFDNNLEKQFKKENKDMIDVISDVQKKFAAVKKTSMLIVLQGMDASGKDGVVRSIFEEVNPMGCRVKSWGKPTEEEFAHDFLWRIHKQTPAKGMIQIFNRSHYEDILVPSVEGYIPEEIINRRFEYINNFEQMLEDNGTTVLKFYLHLSKETQRERLQERLDIPRKHYKHNDRDWKVREKWDQYMEVYERIFERCNKVPWHIVPADQNWGKINVVAKEMVKAFEAMNLEWPELQTEMFPEKLTKG